MSSAAQQNPAALQGWVKSTDPKTGRVFYANHITRKTQWEAPEGWVDPVVAAAPAYPGKQHDNDDDSDDDEPLPSNWEVMHDPTTGKPFYVDHERKITTWTRPKANDHSNKPSFGSNSTPAIPRPTATSSARYAPSSFPRSVSSSSNNSHRSFQTESSFHYNHGSSSSPGHHAMDVDFSDALPKIDFSVQKVADALRPACAHCNAVFTMSKRRHHCRLCGDVFCDACSSHRATLPLTGPEFDKPVRICDYCQHDVGRGNFFSFRRYLTPLHLSDPKQDADAVRHEGVASPDNVNAALSALTADVDAVLHNPGTGGDQAAMDRITSIPPQVLLPEIIKHMAPDLPTANRAVCAIASILALETFADQTAFATAFYGVGQKQAMDYLLTILERSGTDRKTLFVQEQAVRTVCYLTDPKVINAVLRSSGNQDSSGGDDDDHVNDSGSVEAVLDIPRAMRNMLDHSSNTRNPNLQRWSAACIRHLILEDQRQACLAINETAARVASGQAPPSQLPYTSYTSQHLIPTGGVMILSSLMGADDPDTRAHAVGALAATLTSTRAVDGALSSLSEMSAGLAGTADSHTDAQLVRAMVAGGATGASVSQLLLSAEHSVATMGCQFVASLVMPLLSDPAAAAVPYQYDYRHDESTLGACREAAVELVQAGPCLPALVSLVQPSRPLALRQLAMETTAAIVYSIGEMGRVWAAGQYEAGLERAPAPLKQALVALQQEGVLETALAVLQQSGASLGASTTQETPLMRIREAAAIVLGALSSCSAEAILELQSRPNLLSSLLSASADATMTTPSTLRGDASPRCLGVLETMANIIMFAWQQASGAASELLDRLMELLDAGVIPYLSRVLMSQKVDWESRTAVGALKSRAAACRLLCCLFGIALTDTTSIGMRRLMEAVEADARGYRKPTPQQQQNQQQAYTPSNLIEASLSVLQTAANLARKSLVGQVQLSPHHQTVVLDVVDAALLAAGSLCGSSIAPGGGATTGTLVTGESFLTVRDDSYVGRRQEICKVACDVVVRGGAGTALLPTMLVGGFGPGAVLSSLRLTLAIAQNGTKDQHAKLALSGILVPVSDLLKTALSSGDLYKFSAALALVRFCGPHITAGQGGGVESVRDAIRVATNVLTLPINPSASLAQMEKQELLKSECIAALESLSRNASLWSSISKDALPSIVTFLHATSASSSSSSATPHPGRQATRCAALRAVLQIVQVPSHAVSAAAAGIAEPLGRLIRTAGGGADGVWGQGSSSTATAAVEDEMPMLALEVLHVISNNEQARRTARFLETGLVTAICAALGKSATDQPKKPSDSRADVTFLGLEIIHGVISDVERGQSTSQILQSAGAIALVDAVASEPRFVRTLCATLLLKTNMKIQRHDVESGSLVGDDAFYEIPRVYGPPLILVPETCAGHENTHAAAAALLFKMAVYACAIESQRSEAFWKTALLQDVVSPSPSSSRNSSAAAPVDLDDALHAAATLCAHFLALLTADYTPFVPVNPQEKADYVSLTRPLVRHRLLETLTDCMKQLSGDATTTYGDPNADPYMTSLLVAFNVPHICLSLWKDPALLDLAFDLLKQIVEQDPDEVLHLFVEGKAAILSLLDLLNVDASAVDTSRNVSDMKRFLATVLGQLAETGMLTDAVHKFDVRSAAIAALAAACLGEEERPPEEDEDVTSSRLSAVLMRCLVDLCTVKDAAAATAATNDATDDDDEGAAQTKNKVKRRIQLSAGEAEAMAKNLGKKICHMVISRFLERARMQQYEMEEEESIMHAPDVQMLCAIAQHKDALLILISIGGLHALSLIAAEGEISALGALTVACTENPTVLLEGDTYVSMMKLIASDHADAGMATTATTHVELETAALDLLARLCAGSPTGRSTIAGNTHCQGCLTRAMDIVSSFVIRGDDDAPVSAPHHHHRAAATKDDDDDDDDEGEDAHSSYDEEEVVEEEVASDDDDEKPQQVASGPNTTVPMKLRRASKEEAKLGVAACSFLSEMATTTIGGHSLRNHVESTRALAFISRSAEAPAELRYATLKLLTALAPYTSSTGTLTTDALADVLLTILTSDQKMEATASMNANQVVYFACNGLAVIFDLIAPEKQKALIDAAIVQFGKAVKACIVTRASTKEEERAFAAEATYNLTVVMLLARGKSFVNEVFQANVLTFIMHLVQWRHDPKTSLGNTNARYWDAAICNALLLLSSLLWRPEAELKSAGIDLKALAGTSLMLARAGKAPRRALPVKAVLTQLAQGADAATAVPAQRILDRLFS